VRCINGVLPNHLPVTVASDRPRIIIIIIIIIIIVIHTFLFRQKVITSEAVNYIVDTCPLTKFEGGLMQQVQNVFHI